MHFNMQGRVQLSTEGDLPDSSMWNAPGVGGREGMFPPAVHAFIAAENFCLWTANFSSHTRLRPTCQPVSQNTVLFYLQGRRYIKKMPQFAKLTDLQVAFVAILSSPQCNFSITVQLLPVLTNLWLQRASTHQVFANTESPTIPYVGHASTNSFALPTAQCQRMQPHQGTS